MEKKVKYSDWMRIRAQNTRTLFLTPNTFRNMPHYLWCYFTESFMISKETIDMLQLLATKKYARVKFDFQ